MLSWKKLAGRRLLIHPRISVHEDTVELPNGQTIEYIHFGETLDCVTIIPIRSDGKILVAEEYSYPPNEWLYQFPGGGVNPGEALPDAALRELTEETDLTGKLNGIGWFYQDNRRKKSRHYVYIATDLKEKKGNNDVEEDIRTQWFTEEEINDLIRVGRIVNYSILAAWSLFNARTK